MAQIEDIIKRVPVYVELDRPEERIYAIQALYKQLLNVMDVIKSGGGGGSQPGPNTVGTEQIIDNSVIMDDLNDSVRDKIQKTYYQNDESLHMDYDVANMNNSNSGGSGAFNAPVIIEEEEGD